MLLSLNIKNLSLIKSISLDFSSGLNIITGETGSGKSVLLDCISFALGTKSNRVITSDDKGSISLEFDISNNNKVQNLLKNSEIGFEDNIIIRRNIGAKSQIFINDEIVSNNLVKALAEQLIESYRQNDFTGLLDKKNHIEILDNFAEIVAEKILLNQTYKNLKEVKKQKLELEKSFEEREKERDFLSYAINELNKFTAQKGEEDELVEKRKKLSNKKKILEIVSTSQESLEEIQISRNLLQVQKSLNKLNGFLEEKNLQIILDHLEKAITETDIAGELISEIASEVSSQENNLDEVEERLFLLRDLSRKYNVTTEELADLAEIYLAKLNLLNNSNSELENLKKKELELEKEYFKIAEVISQKRLKASENLADEVNKEFPVLNMKGAKFLAEIITDSTSISENGIDEVIFKVATNPGQTPAELAKVASGGEVARVMLALKIALSDLKSSACLIFDEIDTGIGGATADLMGERIKKLAKNQQVVCITHQAQIAGKADSHILVSKITNKNAAEIYAKTLDKKEANEELARMIAGIDITKEARAAATRLRSSV